MKYFTYLLLCLLPAFLISCGSDAKSSNTTETAANDTVPDEDFYYDTLKGLYLGEIGDSPLTVNISFASERHATGYNITKGNQRNVSGSVSLKQESVELVLNEPGDHKYDGVFRLSMNFSDLSTLTGEWESPSGEVKMVRLKRKPLRQDDDEVTFESYDRDFQDSLGTFYFNANGYVRYEYYEDEGLATEQLKKFKGSWNRKQDAVHIFWENNPIFPSKKSVFRITRENLSENEDGTEYFQYAISDNERRLTEIMYP